MRRIEPIALALLAAAPALLWAHKPLSASERPDAYSRALEIEEPQVSQVYYAELDAGRPQIWLAFQGRTGQAVELSLGLPVIERLRGFQPRLALVGPGLPPLSLPFPLPQQTGRVFAPGTERPRFFHEPVTGTDSWILLEITATLPQSGRYYAVAYAQDRIPDRPKLWVSIGSQERFGLADLLRLGRWTRMVRGFHEVGPRLRPGGEGASRDRDR